jgi:type VI secretion system protein ImpC
MSPRTALPRLQALRQQLRTSGSEVAPRIVRELIVTVDRMLSEQLAEVMHHPDFQRLESTWRGLHYLVNHCEIGELLKVQVLNLKKEELREDLENAPERDQSVLSKNVREEYHRQGGEPYGLFVGDYEFSHHPKDVSLLNMIANMAAIAHAPFVAAAAPTMFGIERFTELTAPRDLAKIFSSVEYAAWKSFRESEDSRYVALTLPHVLARLPYGENFKRIDEFNFEEFVDGKDHDKYLWMNAAWPYAARITDAFAKYGWMARTRGVEGGGKVEDLPVHTFPTDDGDVAMKCPTEIAISDRRDFELSNLGFLPLLPIKNRDVAVFMGAQSCQKPKQYFDPVANCNAEVSAKLNYILCVSRFAHYLYLKVMARDKIVSFMEISDCQRWLNDWIMGYVIANPENVGDEAKASGPLTNARVEVRAVKGKPDRFQLIVSIQPHYQLEPSPPQLMVIEVDVKGTYREVERRSGNQLESQAAEPAAIRAAQEKEKERIKTLAEEGKVCPNCGFSYAWNVKKCGYCHFEARSARRRWWEFWK